MIDFSEIPTFALRQLATIPELIVDGLRVLEIGGVTGVEGGFGHAVPALGNRGFWQQFRGGGRPNGQAPSLGNHAEGTPQPSAGPASIPCYVSHLVAGCGTPDLNL